MVKHAAFGAKDQQEIEPFPGINFSAHNIVGV